MTLSKLPPPLHGRPFHLSEAQAFGLSADDLRPLGLVIPASGVRAESHPESLAEHCTALSAALDGRFAFSHLTAAALHGLPLSAAMEAVAQLHVVRPSDGGPVRRTGVRGHRGLELRDISEVSELPVVGLADTWVDMGELIGPGKPVGVDDLIIMGDAIATRLGSVEPLRHCLQRRVRPRGKLTLLEALEWVRVGSESPGETRTRLVLVRAGLPEPILNEPILTRSGRWVGRPDMKYRKPVRIALEYQGREFHDGSEEQEHDAVRHDGFRGEGFKVVPVWDNDVNSDEGRTALVIKVADYLRFPKERLTLSECGPRFFSNRMLELAEIRRRRSARRP
jgi:hypothetical protein